MELFKILGTIAVDNAEAIKGLKKVQDEGGKTESKLGKVFSSLGRGAAAAGKAIATGLAVGAAAMAGLTIKALSLSGDLEQNMGGAEAVFGELGKTIGDMKTPMQQYDSATGKVITVTKDLETVSKEAYKNMGLSQSDYLATANKMGALFKGAGFETQEALDLSSQAMQRAADVASIMGIDTEAAMEAVAGAAKGNFTMMDNLGVAMNDTAIAAYAASKGINKSTQEMSQQEKIGLAMEMFLEKTSYAAGNYAKENETLAGSLGTAKSALTNFLSGSGDVNSLVSSFSNLANVVVRSLTEIAPRLTQGISDIVQQVAPLIAPLMQTLLPVLVDGAVALVNGLVAALPGVIQALMSALPALMNGILQISEALLAALPQIVQMLADGLFNSLPPILNAVESLFIALCEALPQIAMALVDELPLIIEQVVACLVDSLPGLVQGLQTLVTGIVEALPQLIQVLIDALPTIIGLLSDAIILNLPALIECTIQLIMGLVAALPQIIQGLVDAIPTIVSLLTQALLMNLPAIIMGLIQVVAGIVVALPQIFVSLIEGIANIFVGIWDGIKNVFAPLGSWFGTAFSAAWEAIKIAWSSVTKWFSDLWNGIKKVFNSVGSWFGKIFKAAWEAIKSAWNAVVNWFSDLWNGIKKVFSSAGSWFGDIFTSAWGSIKSAWGSVSSWFSGVWNGIKNVFSSVGSWFGSKFSAAWQAVKNVFSGWGAFFGGLWNTISSTFSALGTKISNAISGSVRAGINGVINAIESIINSGISLINGAINLINKLPGVSVGKIDKLSLPRLFRGGVLEKGQVGLLEGSGAEAVVPLENNAGWIAKTATDLKTQLIKEGILGGNGIAAAAHSGAFFAEKFGDAANYVIGLVKSAFGIQKSDSAIFKGEVGKAIASNVVEGIKAETSTATTAMANFSAEILEKANANIAAEKDSNKDLNAEILSVAKEKLETYKQYNNLTAEAEAAFWDDIRKQFAEGSKERIEADKEYFDAKSEIDSELLETAKDRLANYKIYNKMTLAEEVAFWDELRHQFDEGTESRISADKEYLSFKNDLNERILTAEKELQESLAEIDQKIADRKSEYLETFNLFEEFTEGNEKPASFMEMDGALNSQIKALEMYDSEMAALEEKIGGTALFEELAGMGLEGLSQIQEFNKLTDVQLAMYLEKYNKRNELADKMAKEDLEAETIAATQAAYQKFAETCDSLGVTVTKEMGEIVTKTTNSLDIIIDKVAKFTSIIVSGLSTDGDSSGIKWYADAMDNAKILRQPTIFGFNPSSGKYLGGGEAGNEVVAGEQTLMNMIQSAVAEQNSGMTSWMQKLFELVASYFPQMLGAMEAPIAFNPDSMAASLAVPMNRELGRISSRKDRGR